jgi:hypothetical protein
MDQAKVECCNPLEWVEIESLLEAGDAGDELLLAVEAHADIVPHL